jgi:tRNA G18 (ribose-2'-O)-methylase SpoU
VEPAFTAGIPRYLLSRALFRDIDVLGTGYPLLVVKTPEIQRFASGTLEQDVSLLIPFQDPANVGAVVRSAAAFGVKTSVLLQEAAIPFHPKSIRAGGTSLFLVSYMAGPSIHDLSDVPVPVVALSVDGTPLHNFAFPKRFALLPGMEGPGLPRNLHNGLLVSIPNESGVESLNAAVATSIALYEYKARKDRPHILQGA